MNDYFFSRIKSQHLEWLRILIYGSLLVNYLDFLWDLPFTMQFQWYLFAQKMPLSLNYPMYFLLLLSLACATLGFLTRVSGALFLALHIFYGTQANYPFWGWQLFAQYASLMLIFSHCTWRYSVDYYLFPQHRSYSSSIFSMRFYQMQIALLYFVVIMRREGSPDWWLEGRAVQDILQSQIFSRVAELDFSPYAHMLKFLNYGSLALEIVGAGLIFLPRRLARYAALGLIGMHFGLFCVSKLGAWQALLIAGNLTFLFPLRKVPPLQTKWPPLKKIGAKIAVGGLLGWTLSLYILALPNNPMTGHIHAHYSQNLLTATLGLDVMSGSPHQAICVFADEIDSQGKVLKNLYQPNSEKCPTPSLKEPNLTIEQFAYKMRLKIWRTQTIFAEDVRLGLSYKVFFEKKLAYPFCALASPGAKIRLASFLINTSQRQSPHETFFDCRTLQLIEIKPSTGP